MHFLHTKPQSKQSDVYSNHSSGSKTRVKVHGQHENHLGYLLDFVGLLVPISPSLVLSV